MSYQVVRVQKMTSGSVKGIEIHDRREKDKSHTNPDIDFSRSGQNYDLCPEQHEDFYRAVKGRIDQLELKRAVRKDAVVMAQVLVTSDGAFFDGLKQGEREAFEREAHSVYAAGLPFMESTIREKLGQDRTREFFQDAYNFLADRYGAENVISATVHMDEKTPHMHFNFVPVTADGRLCAKEILSKKSLTEQQDAFYESVGRKYGLMRGEPKEAGKRRVHLKTAEYKEYQATIQEARQEAVEAAQSVQKLKSDIQTHEAEKAALEGEISVLEGQKAELSQEVPALAAQISEAKDELATVERAIKGKTDEGAAQFGMGEMQRRIAAARQETEKERRLSLFERFIALPQIAPLWERFCAMEKGKSRGSKDRRQQR